MKKKRFLALMLVFTLLAATFTMGGCGTGNTTSQTNSESSYDGQLVFDHAMELQYAKLFSVEYYKGGYKLLTITNRDEDTAIVAKQSKILLVPEGMSTPSGLERKQHFRHRNSYGIKDTGYKSARIFNTGNIPDECKQLSF